MNKKILLSGYYGFDNSGDDAILRAIVDDFKESGRDIEISALSYNPAKTEEMYGIKAFNRFKLRDLRKAIKSTDLLISGGGSLLQDVTSTRSLIYYLTVIFLGLFYRKKVMVYANGVGPIKGRLNKKLTRILLNRVDLITLRDKDSFDFVKSIGVKNPNIHVTADPVYTLKESSRERVDEIFLKEDIPLDKKLLGISVRKWDQANDIVGNISKSVNYLLQTSDYDIIFIPMHYKDDLEISREIIDRLDTSSRLHTLEGKYSAEDLLGVISRLDIMVAMRLHSLIYAANQKVPMVGISYDPKIDGVLESLAVEQIIDVAELDHNKLNQLIDQAIANRDKLRENLIIQDKKLREKALENIRLSLDLIGEI